MSKQIHGGESDRRKQVKVRVRENVVDAFDDAVDNSEYRSRAEALRELMADFADDELYVDGDEELELPDDEGAAEIVRLGRDLSTANDRVPLSLLESELAKKRGVSKSAVKLDIRSLMGKWIQRMDNAFTDRSNRIVQIYDQRLPEEATSDDDDWLKTSMWKPSLDKTLARGAVEDIKDREDKDGKNDEDDDKQTDGGQDVGLATLAEERRKELGRKLTEAEFHELAESQ